MQNSSTISDNLLLPSESNEYVKNQTHGWLSVEGLNYLANVPYIIYADKAGVQFYEISGKIASPFIEYHPLPEFIRANKMYSYHILSYPLQAAITNLKFSRQVMDEINYFLHKYPYAFAVYVVGHKTGGHKKLVSIGGDCYRPDRGNLLSMLTRTRDLSIGMLRKSSLIFPDIPALTGGKKGEFGIINTNHESISKQFSLDAIFQLSAWIMPMGIQFLNRKIK